ncbi:unnamed protein product [Fraxinus pennsylvanica]|uniref:Uncharacterized protein n=1 Tax=Fraxinus pennsylvanica TaxID=56036 RepID=A0AAD1YLN6_9LAMI|nr:unnamed protein product [Fraxinus pennsylvanica]
MAPSFNLAGQGNQPNPQLGADRKRQKYKSLKEIMKVAKRVVLVENEESDDGFIQKKIINFFRIQICRELVEELAWSPDVKKRRKRSSTLVFHKKRRRILPHVPSEDPTRRLVQLGSLAYALTAQNIEFSYELTYMPGMAPRSANRAAFENGGMQVLSKEDTETLDLCRAMYKRGECPPLIVTFDSCEGYTVEADGPIKNMTFIAEYTGDVDYIKNRELDDCDSMMTLLLARDPSKSLVVCPDKRGNIARFINGINNYSPWAGVLLQTSEKIYCRTGVLRQSKMKEAAGTQMPAQLFHHRITVHWYGKEIATFACCSCCFFSEDGWKSFMEILMWRAQQMRLLTFWNDGLDHSGFD